MYIESGFVSVKYVDYQATIDIAVYQRKGFGMESYGRIRLANARSQTLKERERSHGRSSANDRKAR